VVFRRLREAGVCYARTGTVVLSAGLYEVPPAYGKCLCRAEWPRPCATNSKTRRRPASHDGRRNDVGPATAIGGSTTTRQTRQRTDSHRDHPDVTSPRWRSCTCGGTEWILTCLPVPSERRHSPDGRWLLEHAGNNTAFVIRPQTEGRHRLWPVHMTMGLGPGPEIVPYRP